MDPTSTSNVAHNAISAPCPVKTDCKKSVRFKTCINCNLVLQSSEKTISLRINIKEDPNVNVFDMINYIFLRSSSLLESPLPPVAGPFLEKRMVCPQCLAAIKQAYLGLKLVHDKHSKESYIAKKFNGDVETETDEIKTPSHFDKGCQTVPPRLIHTPIRKKMLDAQKSKKEFVTLQNTVRSLVQAEIQTFVKNTSLASGGDLPSDSILLNEMTNYCPLILKVFQGIFLKKLSIEFSPHIRLAIGVAAVSQSHNVNALQKSIGSTLYKAHAPKTVYEEFGPMGLTCSYTTIHKLRKSSKTSKTTTLSTSEEDEAMESSNSMENETPVPDTDTKLSAKPKPSSVSSVADQSHEDVDMELVGD